MGKKPSERVNGNKGAKKPRFPPRFKNWRNFDPSKVVGDQTLVEELTTYRDNLDELLKRKGDYVLIKGRQVIGIFTDRQEAIEKADDLFGEEPALVKQIVARERIHSFGGIIL
ncbi:MAG TPA: hypothetical protein VKA15_00840 [Isosphaeraceae bacterium]|nr:hypothetical protein [Isosphaeraceae bacterium]